MKSNISPSMPTSGRVCDLAAASHTRGELDREAGHLPVPKGVLVFQLPAYAPFRMAERMQRAISENDFHRVLLMRCGGIHAIKPDEVAFLEHVIKRTRRHRGQVILSEVGDDLLQRLINAGITDLIGAANITEHFDEALARATAIIGIQSSP